MAGKQIFKDQILTLYLNRVYMGKRNLRQSGLTKIFSEKLATLNMLEGAILAGLLKAPARYNPAADLERSVARAAVVLQNMVDTAIIAPEQKPQPQNADRRLRYMTSWKAANILRIGVYAEVNAYIGERENDINVYTTLDKEIQKAAESALREAIFANAKPRTLPTARSWFWIKTAPSKQWPAASIMKKKPV